MTLPRYDQKARLITGSTHKNSAFAYIHDSFTRGNVDGWCDAFCCNKVVL